MDITIQLTHETLLSQLIDFGLDPRDWSLAAINPECFHIQHKADESFLFLGLLDQDSTRWRDLHLISI